MFYLKTFRRTLVRSLVRNPCAEALCGICAPLCGTWVPLTPGDDSQGTIPQGDDSPGGRFPRRTISRGTTPQGDDSPGGRFPRGTIPHTLGSLWGQFEFRATPSTSPADGLRAFPLVFDPWFLGPGPFPSPSPPPVPRLFPFPPLGNRPPGESSPPVMLTIQETLTIPIAT